MKIETHPPGLILASHVISPQDISTGQGMQRGHKDVHVKWDLNTYLYTDRRIRVIVYLEGGDETP